MPCAWGAVGCTTGDLEMRRIGGGGGCDATDPVITNTDRRRQRPRKWANTTIRRSRRILRLCWLRFMIYAIVNNSELIEITSAFWCSDRLGGGISEAVAGKWCVCPRGLAWLHLAVLLISHLLQAVGVVLSTSRIPADHGTETRTYQITPWMRSV